MNAAPDPEALDLPFDPALSGLDVVRRRGIAGALPGLDLGPGPVEVALRGHTRGKLMTLEVRSERRHLAVKIHGRDPQPEIELHEALASALAGDPVPQMPRIAGWERRHGIVAFDWMEGPSAEELIAGGDGARAGTLAASWLRRAATLAIRLGNPLGASRIVQRMSKWVATLGLASASLGAAAEAQAQLLEDTRPKDLSVRLIHASTHREHVLEVGGRVGLISWSHFAQGPLELDAGLFLASIAGQGLEDEALAGETTRARDAFFAGVGESLDPQGLAWFQRAALVRLAYNQVEQGKGDDRLALAGALLEAVTHSPSVLPSRDSRFRASRLPREPLIETRSLPDDPDLPGLSAIRSLGLERAIPELEPVEAPAALEVRAYKPARRITVELRTPSRRLAIKAYERSPAAEVALTETFASAGLTGGAGARVPRVVAWKRELRLLVIEWLEGPTASDLLKLGQGERAADLAASWLERASTLTVDLGPPRDATWMLRRATKWIDRLRKAGPDLGHQATDLAERLTHDMPRHEIRRLAHGTFHDRNIIDCGDGPGVIDWEFAGMGPPELDAGAFMACLSWRAVSEARGASAVRARDVFHSRVASQTDPRALGWHESAMLLCRAARVATRHGGDGRDSAGQLLEMARQAVEGRA
jgi:aminoglycoside phosphotransferase (APT) family kinase protein